MTRAGITLAICISLAGLLLVMRDLRGGSWPWEGLKQQAIAERAVKSQLKAPLTAVFEWRLKDKGQFAGVVHSQNEFGAMLAAPVEATVIGDQVFNLTISGQKLIESGRPAARPF